MTPVTGYPLQRFLRNHHWGALMTTGGDRAESTLMSMAHAEREELAEFLATLTPQQWQTSSLCDRWSVKEVVAHMMSCEELGTIELLKRTAKGRGRNVRTNQIGVEEFADLEPDKLLAFLNNHLHPTGGNARFGGMVALVDGTIHYQDIRRPLGRPRTIPAPRLKRVLHYVPRIPAIGARRRIRGLQLRASDIEWTHGKGPEVTGTGEALLMAMAGRSSVANELSGPGHDKFVERL